LPLEATLAAAPEGFPDAVLAATLAAVTAVFPELHAEAASPEVASPEAALLEVAFRVEVDSRVEVDMVVGDVKRRKG
jgi:hypothetical protein